MAAHEPRAFGDLSPRADNRTSERGEFDWDYMRREERDYVATLRETSLPIQDTIRPAMAKIEAAALHRVSPEVRRLRALPYADYLQSDHWRQFRAWILARDYGCRLCASRKWLEVHHLNYDRKGQERKEDVIVLCRKCHDKWHRKGPRSFPGEPRA
jgi:5-methylcytosine-specific restriction endonuclease McrA